LAGLCGVGVWLTTAAILRVIPPRRLLIGATTLTAVFLFTTIAFFL